MAADEAAGVAEAVVPASLAGISLGTESFALFARTDRTYRATDTATRELYTGHHDVWRQLVAQVEQDPRVAPMKAQVASWQNSGTLSEGFWAHFQLDDTYASGVSISIFENNLNVRLEFKGGQAGQSRVDLARYNRVVEGLTEESLPPDVAALAPQLAVWTDHAQLMQGMTIPFLHFLAAGEARDQVLQTLTSAKGAWLRVGLLFTPDEVVALGPGLEGELARVVAMLRPLYERTREMASPGRSYWKISPGEDATSWPAFRDVGAIAINWNQISDLSGLRWRDEFVERARQELPAQPDWKPKHGYIGEQHYLLARGMREGDRAVVYNNGRILAIGEIVGGYLHRKLAVPGDHQRRVRWLRVFEPPFDLRPHAAVYKEASAYATIVAIQGAANVAFLDALLDEASAPPPGSKPASAPKPVGADIFSYVEQRGYRFPAETLTNYALALETKPFVILTGISGTGKTKIAQLFAEYMCPDEVPAAVVAPENTATKFYVRVGKNLLHSGFIYIGAAIWDCFDLAEPGVGLDVEVRVEGGSTVIAKLLDIKFSNVDSAKQVRLTFKKEFKPWIEANLALNDVLEFVRCDGYYELRRYMPPAAVASRSDRYAFVSVRPDWTDNRGLLGYFNPLLGTYEATEFLMLLLRAHQDPGRPYFVILDEMNLAKVEHYFSDFLSCMESRRLGDGGRIMQEAIALHAHPEPVEVLDRGVPRGVPQRLEVPPNVYFTGTVNVDETTYMFSPKVLDRANTLEFNHVDLAAYARPLDGSERTGAFRLRADFELGPLVLATRQDYEALDTATQRTLEQLNAILMPAQLHFGYRVANEIARYLRSAVREIGPEAAETALDLQILQKVLPKLHGSRAKLEATLLALLQFLAIDEPATAAPPAEWAKLHGDHFVLEHGVRLRIGETPARFPRAAAKVWRMVQAARTQGFTSFVT